MQKNCVFGLKLHAQRYFSELQKNASVTQLLVKIMFRSTTQAFLIKLKNRSLNIQRQTSNLHKHVFQDFLVTLRSACLIVFIDGIVDPLTCITTTIDEKDVITIFKAWCNVET